MSQDTHHRRRRLSLACALSFSALIAASPVFAQDENANPNVIIDYGALDGLTDQSSGGGGETLPAPASKPVSRMLMSSDGSPLTYSESTTSSDETYSAVPTTPIESTDIGTESTDAMGTGASDADIAAAAGDQGAATPTSAGADEPAEAEEQAAETASLTALIEGQVRVAFEPGSHAIPEAAIGEIDGLAQKMTDDPFMRVQVLAYAAGDQDTASVARRVSLGRALAVRGYLVDKGIDLDRMDVRALGNSALEQPADRVDIIPLPQ